MPNPSSIAMAEEWAKEISGHPDLQGGADTSKPYFYLAGKMTGIPKFNFPAFDTAAKDLRERGYNILSPAELDHEIERAKVMQSEDGVHHNEDGIKTWADCLRRDVEVITDPNCVGIICMPGWEQSKGARLETYVAASLGLELYLYNGPGELIVIPDRGEALRAAGVIE